jgi:hypothetical protein
MWMNEHDIDDAVNIWTRRTQPNRLGAALVLANLRDWTNNNSDGWSYWAKPSNAAKALQALAYPHKHDTDCTQADLDQAVRPVKAFLTRMAKETNRFGRPMVTASEREQILRGAMDVTA